MMNTQVKKRIENKSKNIKPTSLLLLLFSTLSTIAFGQSGTIKGSIIDAITFETLIAAAVTIEGLPNATITDLDGNFMISNIPAGTHQLKCSYYFYETFVTDEIVVYVGDTTEVNIKLVPKSISLNDVGIVARANREAENILLLDQKKSLVAIQKIGAKELSRKGIGDAEAAVAKVSGISKQEGVKNVFIRGLEDRYNVTLLNGMPVPSEDPEYKNIALEIFGTDIIQNIGVNKVFSSRNGGDVAGAIIDINSKEMIEDYAFGVDISAGINTQAVTTNFLKPDGANYFGFTKSQLPTAKKFDFVNSLDPSVLKAPINQSYKISGGKRFKFGMNALSVFAVATHNTEFSYTKEIVRSANTAGVVYQDQTGNRYSNKINQLALANLRYDIGNAHFIAYNFMMFHTNNQYEGEYTGLQTEKHQDSESGTGYLRRQQMNDNMLLTHQLLSKWTLAKNLNLNADFSSNSIKGLEPDRRENYLSQKSDGTYGFTGSNRQKRLFSELKSRDYNTKLILDYKLGNDDNSKLSIGYNGYIYENNFKAIEYNFSAVSGSYPLEHLVLDNVYNSTNYSDGRFTMTDGNPNMYKVTKYIHSAFVEGAFQIIPSLVGNIGLRMDYVDMKVSYDVVGRVDESNIKKPYYLPSLNLKYSINDKQALRLGMSKTYTLPQSKEISPYQYVNISFASEGNPKLKPSDNYNIDLKWDYFLSPSELLSAAVFYKRIVNPIGRVDKGNSAGLLTYDNISKFANVGGFELELRKNLYSSKNTEKSSSNKLSFGLNTSYIFTNLNLTLTNTPERKSGLEGASPLILNTDITYSYTKENKSLMTSLVLNYFSNRIYTIGTLGFKDIMEKGVPTLDFVGSYKFNSQFSLKFKAANLLNPSYSLVRESNEADEMITLNQYKKGVNISLGVSFNL